MSRNTLMKYMRRVGVLLNIKMAEMIPFRFGIIFDSWMCNETSEHYGALFVMYTSTDNNVVKLLIACGVQDDLEVGESEMAFSADYGDYILNILRQIGKAKENILFLV